MSGRAGGATTCINPPESKNRLTAVREIFACTREHLEVTLPSTGPAKTMPPAGNGSAHHDVVSANACTRPNPVGVRTCAFRSFPRPWWGQYHARLADCLSPAKAASSTTAATCSAAPPSRRYLVREAGSRNYRNTIGGMPLFSALTPSSLTATPASRECRAVLPGRGLSSPPESHKHLSVKKRL